MHPVYIITIILGIAVLANIFIKIKNKKLIINELIFWILILAALILISVFPQLSVKVAHFLGFKSGFDFFIALSILIIFLFLFNIYKKLRLLEEKFTKLNENIAIKQAFEKSIINEEKNNKNK
ncbi:MAG: DUF2304 domain-containing protein [Actinobacteria bacterium]|nr:DUF2304 domain-containing protein [Actinomycetota bacterium]